jgi:hypothetical protein
LPITVGMLTIGDDQEFAAKIIPLRESEPLS